MSVPPTTSHYPPSTNPLPSHHWLFFERTGNYEVAST
jgi:hypothetical protein